MKKFVNTFLVAGLSLSFFLSLNIPRTLAQPFGGLVLFSIPCLCSGNVMVVLSPPVGGIYSYRPGTQAFPFYNLPRVGVWALGIALPGSEDACWQPVFLFCTPFLFPQGTITSIVGTSE